jgi:hypothetical protein
MTNVDPGTALGPAPLPQERCVYSERIAPSGRRVYYAITSTGDLLNGELRGRRPDESELDVVRSLWRDLNRQDPVTTRPRLVLCR